MKEGGTTYIALLLAILAIQVPRAFTSSCSIEAGSKTYDLSILSKHVYSSNYGSVTKKDAYYLSPCEPIKSEDYPDCDGSYICFIKGDYHYTRKLVTNNKPLSVNTTEEVANTILVTYAGEKCRGKTNSTVTIRYYCQPYLAKPEMLHVNECDYLIGWGTPAMCPEPEIKDASMVPCYEVDIFTHNLDLSSLILTNSSYRVKTLKEDLEMVINVCREISTSPNDPENIPKCEKGVAACVKTENATIDFGRPKSSQVVSNIDTLEIVYEAEKSIPGCDSKPSTKIIFKCSTDVDLLSQGPELEVNEKCNKTVKWYVKEACYKKVTVGNIQDCALKDTKEDSEISLLSLRKTRGEYHKVDGKEVSYEINVCGSLSKTSCKSESDSSDISVCMVDKKTDKKIVIGTMKNASLRSVGNTASIVYKSNTKCDGDTNWQTHLLFECDEGKGMEIVETLGPECEKTFRWKTPLMCLHRQKCDIKVDGGYFSLQRLGRDGVGIPVMNNFDDKTIYINPCNVLTDHKYKLRWNKEMECSKGHPNACAFEKGKKEGINLGTRTGPIQYLNGTLRIALTNGTGEMCENSETILDLICAPGLINSVPRVTGLINKGCGYKMEWRVADACAMELMYGENCKIVNEKLGLHIDLNPLKASTHYAVKGQNNTYQVNVCSPLKGSPCKEDNVGICKVNEMGGSSGELLGNATTKIEYHEGSITQEYQLSEGEKIWTSQIIYICDEDAGRGRLELVEEREKSLVMEWRTIHACSRPPNATRTTCVAEDERGAIYDLSELSTEEGHVFKVDNDTVILNVCRHVKRNESECSPYASVCIIPSNPKPGQAVYKIRDAGRSLTKPKMESKNMIMLEYTKGEPCTTEEGVEVPYSTELYIGCPQDGKNGVITLLGNRMKCRLVLQLTHNVACRKKIIPSNRTCEIQMKGGVTENFTALANSKGERYVTKEGDEYAVNICGPLDKDVCNDKEASACLLTKGEEPKVLALWNSQHIYESFGMVHIHMTNGSKLDRNTAWIDITMVCPDERQENKGNLQLAWKSGNKHMLEMRSEAACDFKTVDCRINDDEGNTYDLTPLSTENLVFYDTTTRNKNAYYLRLCGPLLPNEDNKCNLQKRVSACMVKDVGGKEESLDIGHPSAKPKIEEGNILYTYTTAGPCPNSESERITTYVSITCAERQKLDIEAEPQYCTFRFNIKTPYACKRNIMNVEGPGNCKVSGPGYTIDLAALKLQDTNYKMNTVEISNNSSVIYVNICDQLQGKKVPEGCQNAAVCMMNEDGSTGTALGSPSDKLRYENGTLTLEYNGSTNECKKYTTLVTFFCLTTERKTPPLATKPGDCNLSIMWWTKLACRPGVKTTCTALDHRTGYKYDLSPLSYTNKSYTVKNPRDPKKVFVLNVCQGVQDSIGPECPPGSGACTYDEGQALNESRSLGRMNTPQFVDGELMVIYNGGSNCSYDPKSETSTVIKFKCRKDAVQSKPEYMFMDNCTYHFSWDTPAACPVNANTTKTPNESQEPGCTAKNPVSGYVMDFNPLKKRGPYQVMDAENNATINIVICGEGQKPMACGKDVGACLQEGNKTISLGEVSDTVNFKGGKLELVYSSSEKCPKTSENRTTRITFVCPYDELDGEVMFVNQDSNCTYYINFYTKAACEKKVVCQYKVNGTVVDLSGLKSPENYAVVDIRADKEPKIYVLNVCGPLVGSETSCPPNSAACLQSDKNSTNLSYGQPDNRILADKDGNGILQYTNGSPCPTNTSVNLSTTITFVCGRGVHPNVKYDRRSTECQLRIKLASPLVCMKNQNKSQAVTPGPSDGSTLQPSLNMDIDEKKARLCIFESLSLNEIYDLTPFNKPDSDPYKVTTGNETYLINVCGTTATSGPCQNASVCVETAKGELQNYGRLTRESINIMASHHSLFYGGGDDCYSGLTGSRQSEIVFYCEPSIKKLGEPKLVWKTNCQVLFSWHTAAACKDVGTYCNLISDGMNYDLTSLASTSHTFNTTDTKSGKTYLISLCRDIRYATGCPLNSAVCMLSKEQNLNLGRHDERSVTKNKNEEIVITYSGGSSCGNNKTYSSEITLRCGPSTDEPKIVNIDSCLYKFEWMTHIVCQTPDVPIELAGGMIYDNVAHRIYNMSAQLLNPTVVARSDTEQYILTLNKEDKKLNKNSCQEAAVCRVSGLNNPGNSIGDRATLKALKQRGKDQLILVATTSKTCPNLKKTTKQLSVIINLICDPKSGVGAPVYHYESESCETIFNWRTTSACSDESKPMSQGEWNDYVTSLSSSYFVRHHKAMVALLSLLVVLLVVGVVGVVLMWNPDRRRRILGTFQKTHLASYKYTKDNDSIVALNQA